MRRRFHATAFFVLVGACQTFSSGTTDTSPPLPSDDGGGGTDPLEGGSDLDQRGPPPPSPDDGGGGEVLESGTGEAGGPTKLYAFLTINTYANIADAVTADSKCTGEANGRLSGKFIAWFPSGTTTAMNRLVSPRTGQLLNGPWYRVDNKRIVKERIDLGKTATLPLENAITVNVGGDVGSGSVWTGTIATGAKGNVCPMTNPTKGTSSSKDDSWTDEIAFVANCGDNLYLYCFQVD